MTLHYLLISIPLGVLWMVTAVTASSTVAVSSSSSSSPSLNNLFWFMGKSLLVSSTTILVFVVAIQKRYHQKYFPRRHESLETIHREVVSSEDDDVSKTEEEEEQQEQQNDTSSTANDNQENDDENEEEQEEDEETLSSSGSDDESSFVAPPTVHNEARFFQAELDDVNRSWQKMQQEGEHELNIWNITLDRNCADHLVKLMQPKSNAPNDHYNKNDLRVLDLYGIRLKRGDEQHIAQQVATGILQRQASTLQQVEIGSSGGTAADNVGDGLNYDGNLLGNPLSSETLALWLETLQTLPLLQRLCLRSLDLRGLRLGRALQSLLSTSCRLAEVRFYKCRLDRTVLICLAQGISNLDCNEYNDSINNRDEKKKKKNDDVILPPLEYFRLSCCVFEEEDDQDGEQDRLLDFLLQSLVDRKHSKLDSLHLDGLGLRPRHLPKLAQIVERNHGTLDDTLDLSNNPNLFVIRNNLEWVTFLEPFLKALQQPHVTLDRLNLDGTGISNAVAAALLQALQPASLRQLELWRNPMTLPFAKTVSPARPLPITTVTKELEEGRNDDWVSCLPRLQSLRRLFLPQSVSPPAATTVMAMVVANHHANSDNPMRRLVQAVQQSLSLVQCAIYLDAPAELSPYLRRNELYICMTLSTTRCRDGSSSSPLVPAAWPRMCHVLGRRRQDQGCTALYAFCREWLSQEAATSTTTTHQNHQGAIVDDTDNHS